MLRPPPTVLGSLRAAWAEHASLDRRIWGLAGLRAVNTLGLSLVMSFVGAYLVTQRGVPATVYGAIAFGVNLGQSAASHWAGRASDRGGRVRLMLLSQTVRTLVIAAIGASILWVAPVPLIAALMLANGALRGCFEPVASAMVADLAPPDRRVAAFGLQRMGVNLGWVIGPAAAGLLAAAIGYGRVFLVAVPFLAVATWATTRLEEPARHRATTAAPAAGRGVLATMRARPDVALLLLGAFLFSLAHIQQFTTLQNYALVELDLTLAELGLVYSVNGLAVLVLQVPAVALIGRVRADRAQIVAALLYLTSFLLIDRATGLVGLAGGVLVMTAGEVLLAPAQQATMAELGDPRRLGRAFGALGTVQMLGVATAPAVGGVVFDHARGHMWQLLALIPVVLVAVYVAFAAVRRRVASARGGVVVEVIGPELSGPVQR